MGRYTGPVCRLCRREGQKLHLKGARCSLAKCSLEQGHPAPGMHGGARRARKMSDHGTQLRAKQQLRRQYGLQEGQFHGIFEKALRKRGVTGEIMLQMLETRLDNVVYRLGFAPSRAAARQLVRHNHVTVNGRKANIPSIALKPGDIVQVRDKDKSKALAKLSYDTAGAGRSVPKWLSVNGEALSGEILTIPTRDEIAPIADEQLVVELYSR